MAERELTMDDLRRVLRRVAGKDEAIDLGLAIDNIDFDDLGYDSLALLEAAREIEREYGVTLADDAVATSASPGAFLTLVNGALAEPPDQPTITARW